MTRNPTLERLSDSNVLFHGYQLTGATRVYGASYCGTLPLLLIIRANLRNPRFNNLPSDGTGMAQS